ncbi:DNA-binding protein [Candidatus Berkiella aquae]|uniref:DNA-binding protein n=1 Tax=Candidatus Berkiella aquae TaxID=295108 RepID=A0A0Q9YWJ6_9GAMM|nr:DNA-binding protein [Candidatus Berkiella aquae]MCS5711252.1 DNA-binding protein [Candidatus Berkiella aquae]
MGRIGVSFEEVANAAFKLQGSGKAPTVDAVREILGTGSKTTINQHLKEWKATQTENTPSLPPALAQLVTGLWERLQAEAEEKIAVLSATHAAECETFQSTIVSTEQALNGALQQLNAMTERYQTECKRALQLEVDYRQIKQAFAQLQERHEAANAQLADSKAENSRLHQLANQIQTNLEHYQQAIERLRIEQQLENETRQAEHQHQLMMLREENKHLLNEQAKQNLALLDSQQSLANAAMQHEQAQCLLTEKNLHLEQSLQAKIETEQRTEKRMFLLEQQIGALLHQNQALQLNGEQMTKTQATLQQEIKALMTENHQLQLSLSQCKAQEQQTVEQAISR